MTNHLLIGLGGTGGKIIRSLRKMVYHNLRNENPDNVRLRYLYIDSDDSMMEIDDERWKTLGKSVQLSRSSQLVISGMDLGHILDNIHNYPGIQPWIGSRAQWKSILRTANAARILGGQRRRLGRFLFASKVGEFIDKTKAQVQEMTKGNDITFHICCGLAGGTGSGCVVDTVTQIRKIYNSPESKIILYTLLPDKHPPAGWDTGNYHANGYAALIELNALSMGHYKPHDLTGEAFKAGDRTGESGRLDLQDPFNACYVFTNENEAGFTIDVDKELPNYLAAFLYHKIITSADIKIEQLHRQEAFENSPEAINGEKEVDDGPEMRSRKFFTFGIKQIIYPEDEILEFMTFAFAQQAALQIRFNNWAEGIGFTDQPRNLAFDSVIRNKDKQNSWRLTNDHITLSSGILEEERENKKWKLIPVEWSSVLNNFALVVQQDKSKELWSDRLSKLCEKRFIDDFRGQGVQAFYTQRSKIRQRHVREIRSIIEKELFEAWTSGDQSMQELSQLLTDLRRELEERHRGVDSQITKHQEAADAALERIRENDREWVKVGVLSKMVLNKYEKLLKAKATALEQHYGARTWVQAWNFAKLLLRDLLNEIDDLKGQVDTAASRMVQAVERFEDGMEDRLADEGEKDVSKQVVRFYDPKTVRIFSDRLVKNEEEQKTQTARIRKSLAEYVSPNATFAKFNERVTLSSLLDLFQKQGAENARIAHDNFLASTGSSQGLLGVSVIDKLYERFGGDEQEMRKYITAIVEQALTYARFDVAEKNRGIPGIPAGDKSCVQAFSILMPEPNGHPEFYETLKRTFREATPVPNRSEIIPFPHRKNEIVILNTVSGFPLRFLEPVKFLKDRYEKKTRGSEAAKENAFILHGEGDGSQWPRLFAPSGEIIREQARPYLLFAFALEILETNEDRGGNMTHLVLRLMDDDGLLKEQIVFGPTLTEAEEKLTPKIAVVLQEAVEKELASPKYDDPDEREQLVQRLVAQANEVKQYGSNDAYMAFTQSAREAIQMLEQSSVRSQ